MNVGDMVLVTGIENPKYLGYNKQEAEIVAINVLDSAPVATVRFADGKSLKLFPHRFTVLPLTATIIGVKGYTGSNVEHEKALALRQDIEDQMTGRRAALERKLHQEKDWWKWTH